MSHDVGEEKDVCAPAVLAADLRRTGVCAAGAQRNLKRDPEHQSDRPERRRKIRPHMPPPLPSHYILQRPRSPWISAIVCALSPYWTTRKPSLAATRTFSS